MTIFINDKEKDMIKYKQQYGGKHMKNLSRFFVGAASLVLLTACGPSKVSYAKFHEKAVAAVEKAPEYKKMTCKGTVVASSVTLNLDVAYEKKDSGWELTKGDAASVLTVSTIIFITADKVSETEGATYYAGNGFKVVSKDDEGNKGTMTWNADGYIATIKTGGEKNKVDIKVNWTK